MSSTKQAVLVVAAVALLAAIFAPITRVCPHGPCSTAPDADGYVHRAYIVQPIAGAWLETVSNRRWTLRYGSGVQKDQGPIPVDLSRYRRAHLL